MKMLKLKKTILSLLLCTVILSTNISVFGAEPTDSSIFITDTETAGSSEEELKMDTDLSLIHICRIWMWACLFFNGGQLFEKRGDLPCRCGGLVRQQLLCARAGDQLEFFRGSCGALWDWASDNDHKPGSGPAGASGRPSGHFFTRAGAVYRRRSLYRPAGDHRGGEDPGK